MLAKAGRAESLPEAEIRFLQNILSSPQGVDNLLRTQTLGDHVGRSLQLERVMRWHPTIVGTFCLADPSVSILRPDRKRQASSRCAARVLRR